VERRIPTIADLRANLSFRKPGNPAAMRLGLAQTIWDLHTIAKSRTPKGPIDYTDGTADGEIGIARARQSF